MNKGRYKRSLYFGLLSCPVGLAVGIFLRISAIGDYSEFPYHSTFAAFFAPFLAWFFIIERPSKFSPNRGAFAGVVGVMFAHYLCWYSSLLVSNIQYWFFGIQIGSLGGPPINPIFGLIAVLLYTFISYIFLGWLTIPLGAGIGWIYSRKILKYVNFT